ncbi:uncharacterized protein LOC143082295 isoform X1 [Mytilus galloprovincialis]|uniref:uncharacterized protein LOC143082295 isoform X1 n=1 Tax=Mytilus galloprovincialis TaxID=29158 RepID=UPI003F7C5959
MRKLTAILLIFAHLYIIFQECFCALAPQMILSPDHDQINVKEGQSLEVNCSVKDRDHAEKWQIPYWKARGQVYRRQNLPQNITSYHTATLYFQRIHKSDAGLYKCLYNTTSSVITKRLYIMVKNARSSIDHKCGSNQFKCEGSSHCIALHYRCNNWTDCEDGSDEIHCIGLCEKKFRCLNGKCIDQELVCDKENNCGDASDEYCQLQNIAEQKKDTANTTINATKTQDDHMSWLKTTLYVVIGCTVSVVFFISVIVVAVFRIRMKRNTVRRTYGSERSGRGQRDSGHDPVNYQAEDPFLNMAPSANYGNIIVNVNNGIQYVPGAEFAEFTAIMEAPPSYSDVEQEIFDTQNISPPDYSTIDRNPLRVNSVINVTPTRNQRPNSGQTPVNRRERSNQPVDSRPRTQNAAVQTLTHRSHGRPQSGTDSLPRQPTINVQGGQILLTNISDNSQPTQVSDNEQVSSERPSSALLQVQNGQIMFGNPNMNITDQSASTDIESSVPVDESQENNPRTNIQVCEGQIVLASENTPAVITENPTVNESPSRRQLDVCEGQIVLK